MGILVNYASNMFAGLSDTPQTIITVDTKILIINEILICNRGAQDIRFNLKKVRTQTSPVTIFYVNEFLIKAYDTVDIVDKFALEIFLQYSADPSIVDSLVCFSNGYTQVFDCEVSYTQLNET
jgi:sRNA-binding regulator protein Hfq